LCVFDKFWGQILACNLKLFSALSTSAMDSDGAVAAAQVVASAIGYDGMASVTPQSTCTFATMSDGNVEDSAVSSRSIITL
jgi:hypothetical protein